MPAVILAADVGGTKTRLALFERGRGARSPLREERVPSHDFASLEALVGAFVSKDGATVTHAAIGIAGPVIDQRVEATNLPWIVSGGSMSASLGGAEVVLLNDLEATAWGLEHLGERDLHVLQSGSHRNGHRALIAAGTGLGEAYLFRDRTRWMPSPSEGGHADFAPRDPLEDELLQWLRARHGRVSNERILSGPGLANLYRFFSETGRGDEPAEFAARFAAAADPAVVVTAAALDRSCERARLVILRFCEIYGAEAGNLALKALALGGVFVGGGIAPRLLPFLDEGGFVRAFGAKGRLSPMLQSIPVAVVLDDRTALWGAAAVALGIA
jgi:glucokinase